MTKPNKSPTSDTDNSPIVLLEKYSKLIFISLTCMLIVYVSANHLQWLLTNSGKFSSAERSLFTAQSLESWKYFRNLLYRGFLGYLLLLVFLAIQLLQNGQAKLLVKKLVQAAMVFWFITFSYAIAGILADVGLIISMIVGVYKF